MRPPAITFREAPRFLPVRQQELRLGVRPVRRTVLIYGPVLSLVALWIVHHFAGAAAATPRLFIGLLLAPLALVVVFESPVWVSRIPGLASHFLATWNLTHHGLIVQNGLVTQGAPWSAIQSLHIEETADEITLHLEQLTNGKPIVRSLTCRRADIAPDALGVFTNAVRDKGFRQESMSDFQKGPRPRYHPPRRP